VDESTLNYLIAVLVILTIYAISALILVKKHISNNPKLKEETKQEVTKPTCPKCKKTYNKLIYDFETSFEDENETVIKSMSKCPKCGFVISSRLFSSEKGELR